MSQEIVRRILVGKKKMIFESTEIPKEETSDAEFIEPVPPVRELSEPLLPREEEAEEIPEEKTCECGSTNIITEGGEEICDDCGRKQSPVLKESEKYTKGDIIAAALRLWNSGKYERAMNLCKKYGVRDKEFVTHLMRSLKESELVDKDKKKKHNNVIRSIPIPVTTADRPDLDAAISEAINKK